MSAGQGHNKILGRNTKNTFTNMT